MFIRSFRKFLAVFALILGATAVLSAPAGAGGDGLIIKDSDFGVAKTVDRLGIALERKGIKVSSGSTTPRAR